MTTILSYFEPLFWVLGRGHPQFKRIEYQWMCIWDGVFINLISISDHHSQSRCWTQLGNNLWKNIKNPRWGQKSNSSVNLICLYPHESIFLFTTVYICLFCALLWALKKVENIFVPNYHYHFLTSLQSIGIYFEA